MMLPTLIGGSLLAVAVVWFLLDRREQRRAAAGLPRLSGLRLMFAATGLLTWLFAGGCSLFFLANMDGVYVTVVSIAIVGGPPLLIGLFVWWLAMQRKAG